VFRQHPATKELAARFADFIETEVSDEEEW
jgi:hypothetical protein